MDGGLRDRVAAVDDLAERDQLPVPRSMLAKPAGPRRPAASLERSAIARTAITSLVMKPLFPWIYEAGEQLLRTVR